MNNETSTCIEETCCSTPANTENVTSEAWVRPHYEIDRNEEAFRLRVYVPGCNKSSVHLTVENDLLTLNATRNDQPDKSWKPLRRELNRSNYRLEVRVPEKVDPSAIGANVEDGILHLTLPIREAEKPRAIEVS
ncbi:MAG: HSP20 family protein [Verrucomicrobiales bacterium]|jgi:HSP20 family protein